MHNPRETPTYGTMTVGEQMVAYGMTDADEEEFQKMGRTGSLPLEPLTALVRLYTGPSMGEHSTVPLPLTVRKLGNCGVPTAANYKTWAGLGTIKPAAKRARAKTSCPHCGR